MNLVTGRRYRGSNPVLLSLGMHCRGSSLPYWCGWGEARQLGLAPRRGSRGAMILRPLPVRGGDGDGPRSTGRCADPVGPQREEHAPSAPHPEPSRRRSVGFRPVVVFNAADLVGDAAACERLRLRIERCRGDALSTLPPEPERLRRASQVLGEWPVPLRESGTQACYRPEQDWIELPDPGRFNCPSARLATWAHEAIHSTGHSTRLSRDLSGAFGSPAYAREELVAELGAVLLGERLAIGSDMRNHAAYLQHWCALLRESPKLLLQVIAEARRAADLIAPERFDQRSGLHEAEAIEAASLAGLDQMESGPLSESSPQASIS